MATNDTIGVAHSVRMARRRLLIVPSDQSRLSG
jgi:hypothetical protein